MPEYGRMKNADLEALLKERGLPHQGKKADMVERLQKNDEKKPSSTPEPQAAKTEDEIDWDDEGDDTAAAGASKNSKPSTISTGSATNADAVKPSAIEATSKEATTIDGSKTDGASVQPKEGDGELKVAEVNIPGADYSRGLAATNLDEEIEKRKKRALKFGTKANDDEGLKKLERAKKFGEVGPPKGLDEALPERAKKRGREEGAEVGEGNKRREGGRGGGRGGRGGRGGNDPRDNKPRENREPRKDDFKSNNGQSWMNAKDKAAAEARKAKWAKPSA